jgi:hypothetical protein
VATVAPFFYCNFVLMGLMDTVLGDLMERTMHISQREIWFYVFSDMKFKTKVLDFIRIDQLFEQGVNEDDQVIGRYSIVTETVYNPEKVAGSPYTLKDTGDFYKSFMMEVLPDGIIINADGIKDDGTDLLERFTNKILGLTDESKIKLIKELKEKYYTESLRLLRGY